jgi:hypothetical protein
MISFLIHIKAGLEQALAAGMMGHFASIQPKGLWDSVPTTKPERRSKVTITFVLETGFSGMWRSEIFIFLRLVAQIVCCGVAAGTL